MITQESILDLTLDELSFLHVSAEKCLFFDIETTGLSWKTSYLYLLGVVYYEGNHWKKIQWFSQCPSDEKKILLNFSQILYQKKYLIHFNGRTFDVPYLMHKYNFYQIEQSWDHLAQIDFYQLLLPYKKILHMDSMKQKDLERLIGLYRKDPYSGKELIAFYKNYITSGDDTLKDMLLLHNSEDMDGMLALLPLVYAMQIFQNDITDYLHSDIQTELREGDLFLKGDWKKIFPTEIHIDTDFYQLSCNSNKFLLKIPLYQGTLKYFFPDYKNYYYLKYEDEAIHKSIGAYVDKEYREAAKAYNCYKKVTGQFLPQFTSIYEPCFYENYKDSFSRFELQEQFLTSQEQLLTYVTHLFHMSLQLIR